MLETAGALIGLILAHCALIGSSHSDGELMAPFIIYQIHESKEIRNFEAETQAEAVKLAHEAIEKFQPLVSAWAYAQESLITLENGTKRDAYYIKAWVNGMPEPIELYQLFRPHPFTLIGNIRVLNFNDAGFSSEHKGLFVNAVDTGISSHPNPNIEKTTRNGKNKRGT